MVPLHLAMLRAGVIILGALSASACGDPGQVLARRAPTASETSAGLPPTVAAFDDAEPLIAAESTGGLVELDPATGEVLRSFETGGGEAIPRLSVSPGGQAVYLDRVKTGCWTELVRVPLDGAPEEVLGPGEAPAVSPDGNLLAFLRGDPCSIDDPVLTVRDVATGEEWPVARAREGHRFTGAPAWASDSGRVAMTTAPVQPTGEPPARRAWSSHASRTGHPYRCRSRPRSDPGARSADPTSTRSAGQLPPSPTPTFWSSNSAATS